MKKEKTRIQGLWKFKIHDAKTGKLKRTYTKKNIIPTVGRTAFAAQLAGQETYDVKATYIAIGTNSTPVANTDTTLGTEVFRKAVSSETNTNNTAYIAGFFTAAETNGSYKEFGIFGDGSATQATGSVDTGVLYSHVLQEITKDADETMTVEWSILFT